MPIETKQDAAKLTYDIQQKIKECQEKNDWSALTEMITNRRKDELDRDIKSIAQVAVDETLARMPKPEAKSIEQPDEIKKQGSGYKSLGEFLVSCDKAFKTGDRDIRLKALAEGAGADGGYTVPEEFYSLMEKRALEQSVIRRSGAFTVPAGRSNTIKMPLFKDTSHSSNLFGGWVVYMASEASAMTESSPKIDQVTLELFKMYLFTYTSEELLEDNAVALEAILKNQAGNVIGWYEDKKFFNGTGVGEPLGILNSSSLVSVTRSANSAIALADLAGMLGRLFSNSFATACWYANPTTIQKLAQVAVSNAVWIDQNQGATKSPPARIFGMPMYYTEHCKEINTAGDILLSDPTWYCVYDKAGLRVEMSKDFRFNYDQQALKVVKRFDGRPLVDSAVTLASGTSTQSPFIALAAG